MALNRKGRKLLVASIGVAAVSYVACGGGPEVVANLMAIPNDAGTDGVATGILLCMRLFCGEMNPPNPERKRS
jgi:hypothetical protein